MRLEVTRANCVRQALDRTVKTDYLTEELRRRYRLIGLSEVLEKIHFPKEEKEVYVRYINLVRNLDEPNKEYYFIIDKKIEESEEYELETSQPFSPLSLITRSTVAVLLTIAFRASAALVERAS